MRGILTVQTYIIRDYFDHQHNCMTFKELRALFDQVGRGSALYTICVLGLATGMRCDELLKLTVYHLSPDLRRIQYTVAKASKRLEGPTIVLRRKHRVVELDDWTRGELQSYLLRSCRVVEGVFVSPYPNQGLWPWRNSMIFNTVWYKQRLKLLSKGFDVHRLETISTLQGNRKKRVYVCRFHKLRHIALSLRWYKNGGDLKEAQAWIKHAKSHTTDAYIHSAEQMGLTREEAQQKSLPELLEYDYKETHDVGAPSQTVLDMYGYF